MLTIISRASRLTWLRLNLCAWWDSVDSSRRTFVYVRNQLEDELGAEALLRGGWVVTTTLDLDLQRAAEEIVSRRLQDLRENDAHDAAIVVMDPRTGDILAMALYIGNNNQVDARVTTVLDELKQAATVEGDLAHWQDARKDYWAWGRASARRRLP